MTVKILAFSLFSIFWPWMPPGELAAHQILSKIMHYIEISWNCLQCELTNIVEIVYSWQLNVILEVLDSREKKFQYHNTVSKTNFRVTTHILKFWNTSY